MNVLFYGEYILVKPHGLFYFISNIFKPEFKSIIDAEYPRQNFQLAIVEKVENEKLFVRIIGELDLRQINPDDIIGRVEPSDYDFINKSLPQKIKKLRIKHIVKNAIVAFTIIVGIFVKIASPEMQSQKFEIPTFPVVLLLFFTLTFLIHTIIRFEKLEKRYERDLLVFKYKYKSSDYPENNANNF